MILEAEIGPDMSVPRLPAIYCRGLCVESRGSTRVAGSAKFHAGAPRRALAQTRALSNVPWGCCACEGNISAGAVLPSPGAAGAVKKAAIAVAASILTAVYHMLKDGTFYQISAPTISSSEIRPGRLPSSPVA